jgi:hypothetical protein
VALEGSSWLSWSHHFESFTVATMTWLAVTEYLCHQWPRICFLVVSNSRSFPHLWLITVFVTRLTRRVPLVEQELLTLPEITYNYIPLLFLHSNHLFKQQYVFSLNLYTFLFPLDDYCVSSRVFDVCNKSTGRLLCIKECSSSFVSLSIR